DRSLLRLVRKSRQTSSQSWAGGLLHEDRKTTTQLPAAPCLFGERVSHPRYPFAFSNSAFSRAAPAAPRMGLGERTVNFQSRTLHLRKRPTAVVMPAPRSQSKRGCGRSAAVMYTTGCSGALGRRSCCGSARKSLQTALLSSRRAFCFSLTA